MPKETNVSDRCHLATKEDEKMIKDFSKEQAELSSKTRRLPYQIEDVGLLSYSLKVEFYETCSRD